MDLLKVEVLLADDDNDDCLFFRDALDELPLATSLTIVSDGEQLMRYLELNFENLPDALFLDLNMPRKNGFECLEEIKNNSLLKELPIIVLSTSYNEDIGNQLFETGAYYYLCKPANFNELKKSIHRVLLLVQENNLKPPKENFLITRLNAFS